MALPGAAELESSGEVQMCHPDARAVLVPYSGGLCGTDPRVRPGLGLLELGLAQSPQQLEQEAPSWCLLT